MATSWILGKINDALQPTIHNACSTAGSFAGGAFNTVGSSINSVGESIIGSIRRYGDGAKDYGNSVMDWASAGGVRAQTAGNPLGLSSTTAGGKSGVTSPSIYKAPPKDRAGPSKKGTAVQPSKVVTSKPKSSVGPAKKKPSSTTTRAPVVGKEPPPASKAVATKPTAGKPGAYIPTKPVSTTVKNTGSAVKPTSQAKSSSSGSNPLGLKF